MDVPPTRHSLNIDLTDEPTRVAPKCCPFCLAEMLVTSWDRAARCTRYQCCSCFEVFGRLTGEPEAPASPTGEVVDLGRYRQVRSSSDRWRR